MHNHALGVQLRYTPVWNYVAQGMELRCIQVWNYVAPQKTIKEILQKTPLKEIAARRRYALRFRLRVATLLNSIPECRTQSPVW